MGSSNQADLVYYAELSAIPGQPVFTKERLGVLTEDMWAEMPPGHAPQCEYESTRTVVSYTFASVSLERFSIEEFDLDTEVNMVAELDGLFKPHGAYVIRSGFALVPWYDGADRPVPDTFK